MSKSCKREISQFSTIQHLDTLINVTMIKLIFFWQNENTTYIIHCGGVAKNLNSDLFFFSKAISYIKESSEAISKGQKFTFLHFQNALKFASYQTFFLYSQMEVV